ncbi:dysbindin domain-containing protein 1-like isoform X1 [Brachyhypopomus gauderio]|uniref:dysbindin domain-containing protein 1-like isoform X1 n=1 Tax=Brachyhypopomus gauderio TaxID=698409 RepID=UPI0040436EBA
MEAQGGAGSPADPNTDVQKLLKPSSSGELSKEPSHHAMGEDESCTFGHISGLLHVVEKRQPLSSVSSLEVHFDLLDLTELTDMSDQELAEVFADSDDENRNESLGSQHSHPPTLHRGGYMRSPSWTRCGKAEQPRDRKHHSDSESTSYRKPKQP